MALEEVKVSALPTMLGADVADNDILYVVDVGPPALSRGLTAVQAAQAPQFTSAFKPLVADRVFVPGADVKATSGNVSVGNLGPASDYRRIVPALLFATTGDGTGSVVTMIPGRWATMDIYIWWSNAGAGAGNVRWDMATGGYGDNETTDSGGGSETTIVAAPARYVPRRLKVNTTAVTVTPFKFQRIMIARIKSGGTDTLTNDVGLIGVELVRVS